VTPRRLLRDVRPEYRSDPKYFHSSAGVPPVQSPASVPEPTPMKPDERVSINEDCRFC